MVEAGDLRFLFVKDMDVPTYVEYGVADCGVAGPDVLLETGGDVLEPLDLGFGRCRLVVASPRGLGLRARPLATIRVASKYARVAAAHFLGRGLAVEVVKLAGSVEIAPGLGLADCIVDVVETGRTLVENGLEVIETVAESSARLVVNRASFHARRDEVQRLVESAPEEHRCGPHRRGRGCPAMKTVAFGGVAWRRFVAALPRSSAPRPEVLRAAAAIVRAVRRGGDAALVRLTERFDGVRLAPRQLRVPPREIRSARPGGRPAGGRGPAGHGAADRGLPPPAARARLPAGPRRRLGPGGGRPAPRLGRASTCPAGPGPTPRRSS